MQVHIKLSVCFVFFMYAVGGDDTVPLVTGSEDDYQPSACMYTVLDSTCVKTIVYMRFPATHALAGMSVQFLRHNDSAGVSIVLLPRASCEYRLVTKSIMREQVSLYICNHPDPRTISYFFSVPPACSLVCQGNSRLYCRHLIASCICKFTSCVQPRVTSQLSAQLQAHASFNPCMQSQLASQLPTILQALNRFMYL